jgi:4-hydroxy-tetrahydrodipicolinate synthase
VVTVTPFARNGDVDEGLVRQLVDMFAQEGADGLVVAGSTGEYFSLSDDERVQLFRLVADQNRGRMRLIAGTTEISTRRAVRLTAIARDLGYDGALVLPPPYVLPTVREVVDHFTALDEVGLPLMVYNNPARTGVNLNAEYLGRLIHLERFVALKESTKDLGEAAATLRKFRDEIAIFPGLETYLIPSLLRGAAGVVSMAPNVLGADAISLFRLAADQEFAKAAAVQERIDRLYARMYLGDYSPYVILKEAMGLLERPGGAPRDPLLPMTAADRTDLKGLLAELAAGA